MPEWLITLLVFLSGFVVGERSLNRKIKLLSANVKVLEFELCICAQQNKRQHEQIVRLNRTNAELLEDLQCKKTKST